MSLLRTVLFLLFTGVALLAKIYDKSAEVAGMRVRYKIALPQDYDPDKTYPAVLAFPPGSQTQDAVHLTVEKGESHVLSTLVGTRSVRLYDQIEQSRQGCGK